MAEEPQEREDSGARDFAREAEGGSQGFLHEMLSFLSHTKKWWLAPIIIALLLIGVLVLASSTVLAPFVYTLF